MLTLSEKPSLTQALSAARETRALEIGSDILPKTANVFRQQFGNASAVIIADSNTYTAAGKPVADSLEAAGVSCRKPFIYSDPKLYAETKYVTELESFLKTHEAVPVAVGSGTLNDLTKLASHKTGRSYLCVATAASMDGYTAFGASITHNGSKQTFLCPAPRAVVADLEVIRAAPEKMNAWGYADLIAKVTAGADWILADALGVEPIHPQAWSVVQDDLRELVSDPGGVPRRDSQAIARLIEGLMLGGFAMQAAQSSRAASGAEHQFSHLWDMQHHTHQGSAPSHGFKVGIGTLAVTALYEFLFEQDVRSLDVNDCCARMLSGKRLEERIHSHFPEGDLRNTALTETSAKTLSTADLAEQLAKLKLAWPDLREKLRAQLLPFAEIRSMLEAAGAPVEPEQIGISRERLRDSLWLAYFIRRRFTVLDLAVRTGLLDKATANIFGAQGRWPLPK